MARTVFEAALKRELHEVMQQAKQMANQIGAPEDLWALERYLTHRRKDIDGKYDLRPFATHAGFWKTLVGTASQ